MADINTFIADLGDRATAALNDDSVEVVLAETFPGGKDDIPTRAKWLRLKDVVAVVADLKGSTQLSVSKKPKTNAQLYEAVTRNCVDIVSHSRFDAQFVAIQGDGIFALYHGQRAYQRALCAAITLKTFSELQLGPAIKSWAKDDQFPASGMKVGMHAGTLVVKNVGVSTRARDWKEPVWAGRPVNWAFKCSQSGDAHDLIVTRSVYRKFNDNAFVTHTCGCTNSPSNTLWEDVDVSEKLPQTETEPKRLKSRWCSEHGEDFCQAILDGRTLRDDVPTPGFG